jgi:uncharacterized protein
MLSCPFLCEYNRLLIIKYIAILHVKTIRWRRDELKAVIIYSLGEAWVEGKPFWEQKLRPHREYLVKTLNERLVSAGPFLDHTSGLVITEVQSIEEAEEIAKNDPALEGRFNYHVHPWKPLEGLFVEGS